MVVKLAVLPVADTGTAARPAIEHATAWLNQISRGRCSIDVLYLGLAAPRLPAVRYAGEGGKGRYPFNSQALILDLLGRLNEESKASLGERRLLAVAPSRFLPHYWHLPQGGAPLAGRSCLRHYAIVPDSAPFGMVAHELGHLLFDWPDLSWSYLLDVECLMARGASGDRGDHPSPPCAPLLVRAGWLDSIPVMPNLQVRTLNGVAGVIQHCGASALVELRLDEPGPRLLLYTGSSSDDIRLSARIPVTDSEMTCSLFGILAPHLRSFLNPTRV
jgi:hypothetical protein